MDCYVHEIFFHLLGVPRGRVRLFFTHCMNLLNMQAKFFSEATAKICTDTNYPRTKLSYTTNLIGKLDKM